MLKVTQSVTGENGWSYIFSVVESLLLTILFAFGTGFGGAVGDQKYFSGSQTRNHACEFLNVVDFLSHRH